MDIKLILAAISPIALIGYIITLYKLREERKNVKVDRERSEGIILFQSLSPILNSIETVLLSILSEYEREIKLLKSFNHKSSKIVRNLQNVQEIFQKQYMLDINKILPLLDEPDKNKDAIIEISKPFLKEAQRDTKGIITFFEEFKNHNDLYEELTTANKEKIIIQRTQIESKFNENKESLSICIKQLDKIPFTPKLSKLVPKKTLLDLKKTLNKIILTVSTETQFDAEGFYNGELDEDIFKALETSGIINIYLTSALE